MFRQFIIAGVLLGAVTPASAQDWREELAAEQVVERDGKMVYEDFGILKLEIPGYEPAQIQTKTYSEATADGTISRDNFIAFTASVELMLLSQCTPMHTMSRPVSLWQAWTLRNSTHRLGIRSRVEFLHDRGRAPDRDRGHGDGAAESADDDVGGGV